MPPCRSGYGQGGGKADPSVQESGQGGGEPPIHTSVPPKGGGKDETAFLWAKGPNFGCGGPLGGGVRTAAIPIGSGRRASLSKPLGHEARNLWRLPKGGGEGSRRFVRPEGGGEGPSKDVGRMAPF